MLPNNITAESRLLRLPARCWWFGFGLFFLPAQPGIPHHFQTNQKFDVAVGAANGPRAGALGALASGGCHPMFFKVFPSRFLARYAVLSRPALAARCHRNSCTTGARDVIARNRIGYVDEQR